MPKRRNTQLDFGNNDLQDSSSHPPTTATSGPQHLAQPQERTVLLKLSDACRKHSKFHHNQKASMRADENEADIPDRCRTDIQTLRLLLPRVEKSCKAPKSGQKGGPEATDVAHLCAFYYSVIQGTYCPHQPHIFQWGKGGLEGEEKPCFVCHCEQTVFYGLLLTTKLLPFFISSPTGSLLVSASHLAGSHFQHQVLGQRI
jgi:hypothetical protein